jgi:hypothetical protein
MDSWKALAALAAALGLSAAPPAQADDAEEPNAFDFTVGASALYGRLSGYLQVPLGGNSGTSSPRRPTLRELGIADEAFYEVAGRFRWQHLAVLAGYTGLEPSGSGTLSEPLVSHGVDFAAGSPFHASTSLNVANVGAGWVFDFAEPRLELVPKVEYALLDFSYDLRSPGAQASRAYRTGAARLGAEGVLRLDHGFALELDGAASLPIAHMAQLAGVTGRVSWAAPAVGPLRATLFVGCGARWIDFKDSQTLPNHIHVTTGPLATGGLTISF